MSSTFQFKIAVMAMAALLWPVVPAVAGIQSSSSPTPTPVPVITPGTAQSRPIEAEAPEILADMSMPIETAIFESGPRPGEPPAAEHVARLPRQPESGQDLAPPATANATPRALQELKPPSRLVTHSPLMPAPYSGYSTHATPQLRVMSTMPPALNIYKPNQFRFTIINDGPLAAESVNLAIYISGKGRVLSTSPADAVQQAGVIYFPVGNLDTGESREFLFDFQAEESGQIDVSPRITTSSTNTVSIAVSAPKIKIEISGEDEFVVGQRVDQKILVRNDGAEIVNNLVIRQACSPATAFDNVVFADNRNVIESLAPGQSAELAVSAIAIQPGEAHLQIAVDGENVRGSSAKQLAFTQSLLSAQFGGPDLTYVNSLGTWAITITNDQQRDMRDVKVQLSLPVGMIIKVVDRETEMDATTSTMTWKIPHLPAGGTETLPFKATMSQFGSHVLKASISNTAGSMTNTQMTTQVIGRADVDLKVNTTSNPIETGTTTEVSIQVQNRGTNQADNVVVDVQLPESLTAIDSAEYVIDGRAVRFTACQLAPGQSRMLSVRVKSVTAGDHVVRAEVRSSASTKVLAAENSLFYYSSEAPRMAEIETGSDR